MRVVVAPDKFKGTLTAADVARALAEGWRRADPAAILEEVPVADGGEGTLETLVSALGGEIFWTKVTGPLGDPVEAPYAIAPSEGGALAIVEMARASGLALVHPDRRDPVRATTFGTGELILAACGHEPRKLLVTIGGSATNDAGAGMAQALGVRLFDEAGDALGRGGAALEGLARIDARGMHTSVRGVDVLVACDVDNPLTGPRGASEVYGPQKGAAAEEIARLDRALGHFAAVVHRDLGIDVRDEPGAGAAGGLGGGLLAFLGARLRPGFDIVADVVGLAERLHRADVVLTGEGRFDRQSEYGKAPAGVLRLAREAGCRSVLVAGQVEKGVQPQADLVFDIAARAGLEACMAEPKVHVAAAAEEAARRLMGD